MARKLETELGVSPSHLRWCCDAEWLPFESTDEVEPATGIVGQDDAVEALRFGLEFAAPGQNIFVRGLTGTGRTSLVRQLMEELRPPAGELKDYCYVHNFERPERPRLITLAPRKGSLLRDRMERLVEFLTRDLAPRLGTDAVRARRAVLDEAAQREIRELGRPFEDELRQNGLALVPLRVGQTVQPTILPLIEGKPAPMEQLEALRAEGQVSADEIEEIYRRIGRFEQRFAELGNQIGAIQARHATALHDLFRTEARRIVERETAAIKAELQDEEVDSFLDQVVDDLTQHRLPLLERQPEFTRLYLVNPIRSHGDGKSAPVVTEYSPTLQNLLGSVEREIMAGGVSRTDHLMIQPGSLLRADGGFLIMEARDVLGEPGAWKILMRTLRTGQLEIVPYEIVPYWTGPVMKPDPIPIKVKVVLIGGPEVYHTLDNFDQDFGHLFKVLADFDSTISRDKDGVRYYAGILARLVKAEGLPPFARDAVVALTEHGARIAGRRDRLTARFGRLADIAREAAYLTAKEGANMVKATNVATAIRRGRHRSDLPARRFRKLVRDGTIRIEVDGARVGQINGLAVMRAGPLTYGFPSRITATIGAGTAGAVNIEREAELSGAIHTKGFYILGGLLRHLLRSEHPLAFSASVAFEQSYGGIDGDSASGAEICCLLSALTEVPIRQDLAMTGAIDQHGHVQPVGAVTEKVEGFFATCRDVGLSGRQGVIIPKANTGDLMLNGEVLEACEAGKFHVYAAETIQQALGLLTGREIGEIDAEGNYPDGSLLNLAVQRAYKYWQMASRSRLESGNGSNQDS